ncbi:ester cyclase [Mesorhizobium sp. B2-4-12]|uniref:ester cyclase n=1 Tax=unclassified Mesorhizobium TaxID=325217 RepID=UPI001129DA65|nr:MULTISPECIES: ester cyclase [unclassified Mesorhizobium]TPK92563.1 ester cyclase [Mesorhizobium sp. B2-4-17]TPK94430.1 ester cyclase [Mesorhizobium sp. B2-4-12]TPL07103.1 ester cyclase [Mesorhizobium sp. B2-4-14]
MNWVSGTQVNDFGEYKATGNRFDFAAFQFYQIADGKLAEHWEVADLRNSRSSSPPIRKPMPSRHSKASQRLSSKEPRRIV